MSDIAEFEDADFRGNNPITRETDYGTWRFQKDVEAAARRGC